MICTVKAWVVLLVGGLVSACGGDQVATPSVVAEAKVDAGSDAVVVAGAPTIASTEAVFDFGAIKATDVVEHVFVIRNEGTDDLKIERVQRT